MKITANEVHLWYAYDEEINDNDLLAKYHDFLNEEERTQQKRFYLKKHRHQYLITRALLRSVLSLYVDTISPEAWQFKKNIYNKPFIKNSPLPYALNFNLSHTEKMVVLAVTLGKDIGVDIEFLHRRNTNAGLDIAERFFSKTEFQDLHALPIEQQKRRFFDLWTLKEAYIKARGMGLTIPLDQFSYSFPEPGEIQISFNHNSDENPQYWCLQQIKPNETHIVALAVHSTDIDIRNSISTRKIVPLRCIEEVNHPIISGSRPISH